MVRDLSNRSQERTRRMVDPVQCRLGFGLNEGLWTVPFYFMKFIFMEAEGGGEAG